LEEKGPFPPVRVRSVQRLALGAVLSLALTLPSLATVPAPAGSLVGLELGAAGAVLLIEATVASAFA